MDNQQHGGGMQGGLDSQGGLSAMPELTEQQHQQHMQELLNEFWQQQMAEVSCPASKRVQDLAHSGVVAALVCLVRASARLLQMEVLHIATEQGESVGDSLFAQKRRVLRSGKLVD